MLRLRRDPTRRWGAVVTALALCACTESAPSTAPDAATVTDVTDAGAALDAGPDVTVTEDAPPVAEDVPPPVDVPSGADPLGFAVNQPGPYRVGYHQWRVTYTPRGSTAARTIQLHAWYPTLVARGSHPRYGLVFLDTNAYTDAPAAPPLRAQGYPVHVYSHGHQGFGPTSHFLMRWFASHGWVAVAPDHAGNTLVDTPNPLPAAMFHLRSQDVAAALDAVSATGDTTAFLAGRADVSRVILSGHSAGTHTTWASAGATFDAASVEARCAINPCADGDRAVFAAGLRDPRVVGTIPLAGAIRREWFGATGHGTVAVPVFAMSGSADPVGADAQFMSATGVDLRWIEVRGGCHQFFALGNCDDAPNDLQGPILGTYALAFARSLVLGDASASTRDILDGTTPVHERVTFQRRTP